MLEKTDVGVAHARQELLRRGVKITDMRVHICHKGRLSTGHAPFVNTCTLRATLEILATGSVEGDLLKDVHLFRAETCNAVVQKLLPEFGYDAGKALTPAQPKRIAGGEQAVYAERARSGGNGGWEGPSRNVTMSGNNEERVYELSRSRENLKGRVDDHVEGGGSGSDEGYGDDPLENVHAITNGQTTLWTCHSMGFMELLTHERVFHGAEWYREGLFRCDVCISGFWSAAALDCHPCTFLVQPERGGLVRFRTWTWPQLTPAAFDLPGQWPQGKVLDFPRPTTDAPMQVCRMEECGQKFYLRNELAEHSKVHAVADLGVTLKAVLFRKSYDEICKGNVRVQAALHNANGDTRTEQQILDLALAFQPDDLKKRAFLHNPSTLRAPRTPIFLHRNSSHTRGG
ncbi:hypothetical protein LTR56_007450 [Elasticomyces elasticus]|nr:hypothetical protein LTR56_007450 [Elasticomyces elasticus]KAK3668228.1 hypothetical protein LTR22_000913 [Elasticomyces elasticus]